MIIVPTVPKTKKFCLRRGLRFRSHNRKTVIGFSYYHINFIFAINVIDHRQSQTSTNDHRRLQHVHM